MYHEIINTYTFILKRKKFSFYKVNNFVYEIKI